jgi:hypothetical protein
MGKPVRVTITGPADGWIDAPTVDDLLGQIRDFLDVLRGVERAAEAGGTNQLVWRVTDAAMNSPISLELTPFGAGPAAATAARAERVERIAIDGLKALRRGEARPPYFTDDVIAKARKLHSRVTNGLSDTIIALADDAEPVVIDRAAARDFERTMERAQALASIPYKEFGSVEGFVTKPELDGYGRAILRFKARLGGAEIKAFASGHAFRQVEALTLHDVWEGVRVRVYGTISYKTLGQIEHINATGIEVLDTQPLPGINDIVDPNFTGGLSTEEFLRELRRDD